MNAKLAKRIRRVLNERLAEFNLSVRDAQYADVVVRSRRGQLKNTETGEIINGALQRRMTQGCPRDIYKRTKRNVEQQRSAR